ncbi:hypothetical protein D3C79_536560 [compost metagenome]
MPNPAAVAICAALSDKVSLAPSATPLNASEAPLTWVSPSVWVREMFGTIATAVPVKLTVLSLPPVPVSRSTTGGAEYSTS